MSNLCDRLVEACRKLNFKVKDVDDSIVIVRYQMHFIHICYNEKSQDDCTVMVAVEKNVTDEGRLEVLERCNALNGRLKHFKYYIMGPGVVAAMEFLFNNDDGLAFQLGYAVRSICQAKAIYERNV